MKVRYLFLLFITLNLLLTNCKKEQSNNPETPVIPKDSVLYSKDFILAGDSMSYKYTKLNITLDNISYGNSVPSNNKYTYSTAKDTPFNIDDDIIPDIRFGYYTFYRNDYAISKAFFVKNNYGNEKKIEFAVATKQVTNLIDTNFVITLFNKSDTINSKQLWLGSDEPKMYLVSLLNTFEPYFKDYIGSNISVHKNEESMYIGLRRKVGDNYIYGWIRISVKNSERFDISGSSFSFWYKKNI